MRNSLSRKQLFLDRDSSVTSSSLIEDARKVENILRSSSLIVRNFLGRNVVGKVTSTSLRDKSIQHSQLISNTFYREMMA